MSFLRNLFISDETTGKTAGVTLSNELKTIMSAGPNADFFLEAGKGNLTGYAPIFFSGENENIGSSPEMVAARGGVYVFPASASTLTVVSDDANDTSSGTGAQSVVITGLDANHAEIIEVVSTNGLTPVATTLSFLRVNAYSVATAGSGNQNAGELNVLHGTDILSQILATEGTARQPVQTVPAGRTWFAQGNHFSCGKADEITVLSEGQTPTGMRIIFSKVFMYQNQFPFKNHNMIPFPEKFDVVVTASRFAGTSAKVAVFTQFFEVENAEF